MKRALYIIIIILLGANAVVAQQQKMTPYEKRMYYIVKKYYSIARYGYEAPLSFQEEIKLKQIATDKDAREFIIGIIMISYAQTHSKEATKKLLQNMERDLKAAEKLKTAVDYQREKQRKFAKSDMGQIQKRIKEEFSKWNTKDEFETQAQYEKRLKEQSKDTFIAIATRQVKQQINEHYGEGPSYSAEKEIKLEPLPYNADNKKFTVLVKTNGKEFKSSITLEPEEAKSLKDKLSYSYRGEIEKDYYNWCQLEYELYPKTITIEHENKKYIFRLPLKNCQDIKIPFDNLKINNKYLKGYVYNYSKQREYEKQKYQSLLAEYNKKLLQNPHNKKKLTIPIDSLSGKDDFNEKVQELQQKFERLNTHIENSHKFDSLLTEYNKKLIKNPYNKRKLTLPDDSLNINEDFDRKVQELRRKFAEIYQFIEFDSLVTEYNKKLLQNPYNIHKIQLNVKPLKENDNISIRIWDLKEEYMRLQHSIEQKLRHENPKKYIEIYYSLHPEHKALADKKYPECRCLYNRKAFDLKFIKIKKDGGDFYECDCRRQDYAKYGHLFSSKQEFDEFFNKNDSIYKNEIAKREITAYIKDHASTIKNMDLRKDKKESFATSVAKNYAGLPHNDYTHANDTRKDLIEMIEESKTKTYYPEIVELLIQTNKKLNREWNKNGQYFKDKIDFFNTYLYEDYKQILKNKKL